MRETFRGLPDRDRLSVLVGVILLGFALSRVIELPGRFVDTTVFGTPLGIHITTNSIMLGLVSLLAATGSDSLVRSHPDRPPGLMPESLVYWVHPGLTALVIGGSLNQMPDWMSWWFGLAAAGVILGTVLILEFVNVDPENERAGTIALLATMLNYALALAMFTAIYATRSRSILTATSCAIIAFLLAARLLWERERNLGNSLLYAGIVGLAIGQAVWALNYWRLGSLPGGLVLTLLYYSLSGLAQQHLQGRLNRRVLAEFGVVALTGLLILWRFGV